MFGGWSALLSILTLLIILDFISGLLAAGIEGKLSSRIGFKGIAQKIIIFCLVSVAHIIDLLFGQAQFIMDATIFFYMVNEMLSIIENAGRVGLPIPKFLVRAIERLKEKSED